MEKNIKVLVVDDDRRMVKTTCDILKIKGYSVAEASTGEEALLKVRNERPDCLLMDFMIAGIDGNPAPWHPPAPARGGERLPAREDARVSSSGRSRYSGEPPAPAGGGSTGTLRKIRSIAPELPVLLMSAYAGEDVEAEARRQGAYAVLPKLLDLQMVLFFLSMLKRETSVLIVDDDPVYCRTLQDILEARGCRVETEMDPGNVLSHMEQSYKLVVLLDLKVGRTDGNEVLQAIRNKYPSKPVILLTAHEEDMGGSIAKGLGIGAYTCIYKPLQTELLVNTISEIRRTKLKNIFGEGSGG